MKFRVIRVWTPRLRFGFTGAYVVGFRHTAPPLISAFLRVWIVQPPPRSATDSKWEARSLPDRPDGNKERLTNWLDVEQLDSSRQSAIVGSNEKRTLGLLKVMLPISLARPRAEMQVEAIQDQGGN